MYLQRKVLISPCTKNDCVMESQLQKYNYRNITVWNVRFIKIQEAVQQVTLSCLSIIINWYCMSKS